MSQSGPNVRLLLAGAAMLAVFILVAADVYDTWRLSNAFRTHEHDASRRRTAIPLRQPEIRRSSGGVLATTLRIAPARVSFFGPHDSTSSPFLSFRAPVYGTFPGPTLVVHQGDTLHIKVVNTLGDNLKGAPDKPNTYRHPNTTILHVHGMHVSPAGHGDNMFHDVEPGEDWTYTYQIRHDHPAGLFYYHPHYHGSSTLQMLGQMAGAIVVVPAGDRGEEGLVMVLQRVNVGLKRDLQVSAAISDRDLPLEMRLPSALDARALKKTKEQLTSFIAVNGQWQPEVVLVLGAAATRWRLVHAGVQDFLLLRLDVETNAGGAAAVECEMWVEARDGQQLSDGPRLVSGSGMLMAPGSRADILVRCRRGRKGKGKGRRQRSEDRGEFPRVELRSIGPTAAQRSFVKSTYVGTIAHVAMIAEEAEGKGGRMADWRRPPHVAAARSVSREASLMGSDVMSSEESEEPFRFMWTKGEGKHMSNGIAYSDLGVNGVAYDSEVVNRRVALGSVQEWVIDSGGLLGHPFHLHVNHFQIVASSCAQCEENGLRNNGDWRIGDWRDTITVPAPGNVTVRWRAKDYTGRSLAHCHIFSHSDTGMALVFDIQ